MYMKPRKARASHLLQIPILQPIVALLIVLVAFSILILFNTYKPTIIGSGAFIPFLLLTVLELGLLLTLLFIVNSASHKK